MRMQVELHELHAGDVLLDPADQPTVKGVQILGPISIVDLTDHTAFPPYPSRCVANIERKEPMTLRMALAHVQEHGFGDMVDADSTIEQAAEGLVRLFDEHGLASIALTSCADQCADLYELFNSLGMAVA